MRREIKIARRKMFTRRTSTRRDAKCELSAKTVGITTYVT